jgi:predicted phage terminase large subunit-like protein
MILISKERLQASIYQESFYDFVQGFWDTVVPEPIVLNWHMQYICDELQTIAERVFRKEPKAYDLVINISPGTTKSTIASEMYPAWIWTRMPSVRFIGGSYAHLLALDLSRKSRMIIQSEKYRKLFPEIQLSDDQNTKSFFANTDGGARMAVGVCGSVTGFHGHFIVIDDPLDPNGSFSEADLKTTNNWMRETLPTRKVDKEVVPTILIQQRLHENDSTGDWLERSKEGDVKHICLPAELTPDVRPVELRENYIDGLMDPVRLSRAVLQRYENDLGAFGYACQFLQKAIPRGGGMFKVERILIDTPPGNFVGKVRYWDKAGTSGAGCYTVGVLMGRDCGRFWILDVVRGQWDAHEREAVIKETAKRDGPRVQIVVEQEPGSGGKESAENTIRNLAGYRVKADRPTGDKVMRSDPFSAQVNGGNVRMVRAEWNADFINEMKYFPNSKYKDQADASSGAFASLNRKKIMVGGFGHGN